MRFLPFLPLFFLAGCARTQLEPASNEETKAVLQEEAKDAQNSFSGLKGATLKNSKLEGNDSKGRPLWRLEAKEIRTGGQSQGAPQTATLTGAKATLFQNGRPDSTLAAPLIQLFNTAKGARLHFPNGVKAQSAAAFGGKRVELSAPRGDVDVTKKLVVLSGGATAKQGQIAAKSATLRAQTSLARAEMSGGMSAQNPDGKVNAQSATYDWKAGKLSAQVVVLTRQNTTLRGQKLDADTLAKRGILRGQVRAQAPNGSADAPILEFDFARDRLETRDAMFANKEGKGRAARLQTDSKLRVSSASGLQLEKDGALLRAESASGFERLSRVQGRGVRIVRGDQTLTAASADARDWNTPQAVVSGQNVVVSNSRGVARTARATLQNEQILANGGLEIESDGQNLRAQRGQSDLKFEVATLRGQVRAKLKNGVNLRAPLLEKRGEKIVASGGATGVFPSKTTYGTLDFSAQRMETLANGERILASGGVKIRAKNGAVASAKSAIYDRTTQKITAAGGVTFADPKRGFTQRGTSLVADLQLREVVVQNPQGQGNAKLFDGKALF